MEFLNLKAGDSVLYYDKEGQSTFEAKFIGYDTDGIGRLYFSLEIEGETHELMGEYLPFVKKANKVQDKMAEYRQNAIEYWIDSIEYAIAANDDDFDTTGISQQLLDYLESLK